MRFPAILIPLTVLAAMCVPQNVFSQDSEKKKNPEKSRNHPKAWLRRVSKDPPGPYKELRPMQLSYILSWKGKVKAGVMEFKVTQPYPGVYHGNGGGKSIGLARALFPYDFTGSAQTNTETLKPLKFEYNDKMKSKSHKYTLLFQPDQMISETEVTDNKTGHTTPYRYSYRFRNDVGLDLLSSVLYLRSQPLTTGQKLSIITATFNKPYLTEFRVMGREKKTITDNTYDSIKLDVKISKIHGNMTIEPYSKIEKATIWISDDEYRVPLEFHGEIFIGYISARITERKFL